METCKHKIHWKCTYLKTLFSAFVFFFIQVNYLSTARSELHVNVVGDSTALLNSNVKLEVGQHFNASCSSQSDQYSHIQSVDDSFMKPFPCPICGKRFGRLSHVQRHQSVHTGDKPFQCEVCQERFTRLENRELHMADHTHVNNSLFQVSVSQVSKATRRTFFVKNI